MMRFDSSRLAMRLVCTGISGVARAIEKLASGVFFSRCSALARFAETEQRCRCPCKRYRPRVERLRFVRTRLPGAERCVRPRLGLGRVVYPFTPVCMSLRVVHHRQISTRGCCWSLEMPACARLAVPQPCSSTRHLRSSSPAGCTREARSAPGATVLCVAVLTEGSFPSCCTALLRQQRALRL